MNKQARKEKGDFKNELERKNDKRNGNNKRGLS